MPLFEGGKFNKAALGPLQNLFRSRGGGSQTNDGSVFTGPYAPDYSGGGGNNFWEEGLNAQEDLESAASNAGGRGQWFQNIMNGKSKQPLINTEDQTMRLPNFLFPKQNPKSILNLPGKLFNQGKEGLEKTKDAIGKGYGDVFGEGGMLAKADFGGVVNPWAARDARNAGGGVSPEEEVVGGQGGMIDPTTYNQDEVSETPTLDAIKGGVSSAYQGFKNLDLSQYANPDENTQSESNVKFNMSGKNSPLMKVINQGWEGLEDQSNRRGEFKNIFESKLASGQNVASASGGALRDATSQINPEEHPQHQISGAEPVDMTDVGRLKSQIASDPKFQKTFQGLKMYFSDSSDDDIYNMMLSMRK